MNLQTPLLDGNRSLKTYANRLTKLNIFKVEDLLYHIPFRYDDYSLTSKIGQAQQGEIVTIKGHVVEAKNDYTRRFKTLQRVTIADETGNIELTWFNQPYIVKSLKINDTLSVAGKVDIFGQKLKMVSPVYENLINSDAELLHTGRLVPIYPETAGVSSKWLRRQIFNLLKDLENDLNDYLPEEIKRKNDFLSLYTALSEIHFPSSFEKVVQARKRLSFDELFLLQLSALERKKHWSEKKKGYKINSSKHKLKVEKFISSLPFQLTSSQEKAIEVMVKDLAQERPMNRLLQGDVGSGKTVVAAVLMYITHLNNLQSVLMAPTEILAEQHFATLKKLLEPFDIRIGLTTGSKKTNNKQKDFDILVGTHALLTAKQEFGELGLVIIDEQQRFGVQQRGIMREKGQNPHLLTMTATPIPRTAALTLYGDLDVSYLHDMPKGRKAIKTWLVPPLKRDSAYEWIRKELKENNSQAFIICPFIEESENMQTVKAASKEYERLQKDVYPDLSLGLLHGKLKAREKEEILQKFRNKEYEILVATPVVEVGIDIPNATIILIEAAERFGLAGLHQLRGRVGRGDKQSYCLLFTESKADQTTQRLKAMETMQQGAELAEYDLKLRGPGEIFGLRQSGSSMLKIASFSETQLIERAKDEAQKIFPQLNKFELLDKKIKEKSHLNVNPD